MDEHDIRRTALTLAHRVPKDAGAAQIADVTGATWQAIDAALAPIIGSRGVAALYKRSLHLAGSAHPWLAGAHQLTETSIDLAALKSAVVQQSSAEAMRGAEALLQTFHRLLTSLIGSSLTERLLRPVWPHSSSDPSSQDSMP